MANETNIMESTTIQYTGLALLAIVLVYPAFHVSIKQHFLRKIKIILQKVMSSEYWRIMILMICIAIYFQIFIIWNVPFKNVFYLFIHFVKIIHIGLGVQFLNTILSNKIRAMLPNNIRIYNIPVTKIYHLKFGTRSYFIIDVLFSIPDILCYMLCAKFGVCCIYTEYWIMYHIFSFATLLL